MSPRQNGRASSIVAGVKMTYTLQAKAAPFDDPAAPIDDTAAPPPPPNAEQVAQQEWAGDIYTGTDVTDPANAAASFSGTNGETAWLDQADDRTLTGWVEDADGTVRRYSDVDAWAIDVDQASMTLVAESGTEESPEAEFGDETGDEPTEPAEGEDPFNEGAPPAEESAAPLAEAVDTAAPEEVDPMAEAAEDPSLRPGLDAEPAADPLPDDAEPVEGTPADDFATEGEPAEGEEDEELEQMLGNLEKKSWASPTGGPRLTVRRVHR